MVALQCLHAVSVSMLCSIYINNAIITQFGCTEVDCLNANKQHNYENRLYNFVADDTIGSAYRVE